MKKRRLDGFAYLLSSYNPKLFNRRLLGVAKLCPGRTSIYKFIEIMYMVPPKKGINEDEEIKKKCMVLSCE